MKILRILFNMWIFVMGFFVGGMLINMLIFNKPEAIYIAEALVACKDRGGIAYLPASGRYAKCQDGGLIERPEGPEVIRYFNYIKSKQILGVSYIDYINFDYNVINYDINGNKVILQKVYIK